MRLLGLISALVTLIWASACQAPSAPNATSMPVVTTKGQLVVSLTGRSARTIFPDNMSVARFVVTGTGPQGSLADRTFTATSFVLKDLDEGNWTISVDGVDSSGNVVLSGSAPAKITAGTSSAVGVNLTTAPTGQGNLDLHVTWPEDKMPDELIATLTQGQNTVSTQSLAIVDHGATGSFQGLPPGSYFLTVAVRSNGVKVARTLTDSVLVFGGHTSTGVFPMADQDFGKGVRVLYASYVDSTMTGALPTDETFYAAGTSAPVKPCSLARPGYTFSGWFDTDGVTHPVGSNLTVGTSDTILTANWTPIPSHLVTYDWNDDGYPDSQALYYEGELVQVLNPDDLGVTQPGYVFASWNSQSDGTGATYAPGQTFAMGTEDLTLWGRWTGGTGGLVATAPSQVTVTLTAPESVARGDPVTASAVASQAVDSYSWYLDGTLVADQTSAHFSGGTALSRGPHGLMVVVSVRGILYSASAGITVQAGWAVSAVPGNRQVTLTWDGVIDAVAYHVYYSTSPGVTPQTGTELTGANIGGSHKGLTNGSTYYYAFTAVNAGGTVIASAQAQASPTNLLVIELAAGSLPVVFASIDVNTGALTRSAATTAGTSPMALDVTPSGQFVYVANNGSSNVSAYKIDRAKGTLSPVSGSPFAAGTKPMAVAVHPAGTFCYVANTGTKTVSAYTIHPTTGALTSVTGSPFSLPEAPLGLKVDPLGRFCYVWGTSLSVFAINQTTGVLTKVMGSPFSLGYTSASGALDPAGRFLYLTNSANGALWAYQIDGTTGVPQASSGSPFAGPASVTSIAVDPSGRHLYNVDFSGNSVSTYAIDSATGNLSAVVGPPASTPNFTKWQAFESTGTRSFVFALSGSLSIFAVDPASGALSLVSTPTPATNFLNDLRFVELP